MNRNTLEHVVSEFNKFSSELIDLGSSIEDNRVELFEKNNSLLLPIDFKKIIKMYNGFSLSGTQVYGIGEEFRGSSLEAVYNFEHFAVNNQMSKHFVPFSPDGRGNHYCLDLSRLLSDNSCPIVFWQSSFIYNSLNEVETCNDNFIEWVQEVMIDWTLEDYNYDGSEK
jgi:hypothetical protein